MAFKEWLKRRGIKTSDHATTKAAELTLRESVFPICLVTILFFLWGLSYVSSSSLVIEEFLGVIGAGLTVMAGPPRHPKQAFPRYVGHYQVSIFGSPGRLFWVTIYTFYHYGTSFMTRSCINHEIRR